MDRGRPRSGLEVSAHLDPPLARLADAHTTRPSGIGTVHRVYGARGRWLGSLGSLLGEVGRRTPGRAAARVIEMRTLPSRPCLAAAAPSTPRPDARRPTADGTPCLSPPPLSDPLNLAPPAPDPAQGPPLVHRVPRDRHLATTPERAPNDPRRRGRPRRRRARGRPALPVPRRRGRRASSVCPARVVSGWKLT